MQQAEDKNFFGEALIAEMKGSLLAYEMPYIPGAWEDFCKKERRKYPLFWIFGLGCVTVATIIGFALFDSTKEVPAVVNATDLISHQAQSKSNQATEITEHDTIKTEPIRKKDVVQLKPYVSKTGTENITSGGIISSDASAVNQLAKPAADSAEVKTQINSPAQNGIILVYAAPISKNEVDSSKISPAISGPVENAQPEYSVNSGQKDSPAASATQVPLSVPSEKRTPHISEDKEEKSNILSKWSLGLSISPSTAYTRRMNIGFGALAGYEVFKNISLKAGILYNQYDASEDALPVGCTNCSYTTVGGVSVPAGTKVLLSTNARFTGFEIPMEMRYRFGKGFFAGAGGSIFSALNRKEESNSLLAVAGTRTVTSPSGNPAIENYVSLIRVKEALPQSALKDKGNAGFYTFSAGYTLPGRKYALSFEPFLKIPVNKTGIDDFKIKGAGVNVNFIFKFNKPDNQTKN